MFTSAAAHNHDWKASERRSCRREPLQWAVLVFFGDNWGKLIDVSERGMSFQFAHPPSPDEPIQFTFEAMGCMPLPHDGKIFNEAIQATGQVVWTLEFERTAGVKFLELSSRSRDQIRYWMSSVPSQESSQETVSPSKETDPDWDNVRNKQAAPTAPEPLAPPEPAAFSEPEASEPPSEVFEKDDEDLDSENKVPWEPTPSFSPRSHEPSAPEAEVKRKPKSAFASLGRKPGTPQPQWSGQQHEPEASFAPQESAFAIRDSEASETEFREESEFEPAEPSFAPKTVSLPPPMEEHWQPKPMAVSQKLQALGFESSGFPKHEERHQRGQTLELKQRRARIGYAAVLSFLVTLGALAGIIGFISKFNERAEGTPGVSHQSSSQDSNRTETGAVAENAGPFLVEVLDANSRRSVLWFTGDSNESVSASITEKPVVVPASTSSMKTTGEEKAGLALETKHEETHDFSLISPHASVPANASAENSAAPVAPAMPGEVPVSTDVPLSEALPNPAMPASPERSARLGGDVQAARLIHATLPIYPELAKTSRTVGDVTLDALVDEQGNVRDVKVISGPVLLQEAAKTALRQWRYEPARLDGQPTSMHLTVTIKFRNAQANP